MYKYTLHKKSTKHLCPNCNKRRLVLYIDVETNEYLATIVGRCDREINCGYHYPPKSYFEDSNQPYTLTVANDTLIDKQQQSSYHNENELLETLSFYNENNLIQFLKSKFEKEDVEKMASQYHIGTANFWNYGTVFWQVDSNKKIRGGKIIIYSKSGKRTKYINWIHSIKIKSNEISNFNLNQCFFGEHLIPNNKKTIAIVESEKTACIMSLLFDKYLWLASGSLNGLNQNKMEILRNQKIILYPDLGINGLNGSPFSIWNFKCESFKKNGFDINISNLLEIKGSIEDRKNGYDIADYFLENQNHKPKRIISNEQKIVNKLYHINQNLKILIDVFDLRDNFGNEIKLP